MCIYRILKAGGVAEESSAITQSMDAAYVHAAESGQRGASNPLIARFGNVKTSRRNVNLKVELRLPGIGVRRCSSKKVPPHGRPEFKFQFHVEIGVVARIVTCLNLLVYESELG